MTAINWCPLTAGLQAEIKGHFLHSVVLELSLLLKQPLTYQVQGLGEKSRYFVTEGDKRAG